MLYVNIFGISAKRLIGIYSISIHIILVPIHKKDVLFIVITKVILKCAKSSSYTGPTGTLYQTIPI